MLSKLQGDMRTQTLSHLLSSAASVLRSPSPACVAALGAGGSFWISDYVVLSTVSALSLNAVHTSGFLSGWETTLDSKQLTPQPGPPEEGPACPLKEEKGSSADDAQPSTSGEALGAGAPGVWDTALKPVTLASENTLPPQPPGDSPQPQASRGPDRVPACPAPP